MKLLNTLFTVSLVLCPTLYSTSSLAQTYPAKPVRLLVPFPPGGISDTLARITAQQLGEALSQSFVVENRPGAGTTIAADLIAKAAADGHTLYFTDVTTHAINASLYAKLPFDTLRDFSSIALVAQSPLVLVVHPSMPVKSVPEFIALAKSRPDDVVYASSGNGTIIHLGMEAIRAQAGIKMVHVPYKGVAPAMTDVIAGHVDGVFIDVPVALAQIKGGKLKALGLAAPQRHPSLPNTKTFAEMGVTGVDSANWYAIFAAKGTPAAELERLNQAVRHTLSNADVKKQLASIGAEPAPSSPAELTQLLKSDLDKWGRVIRAKNIKPD